MYISTCIYKYMYIDKQWVDNNGLKNTHKRGKTARKGLQACGNPHHVWVNSPESEDVFVCIL